MEFLDYSRDRDNLQLQDFIPPQDDYIRCFTDLQCADCICVVINIFNFFPSELNNYITTFESLPSPPARLWLHR